MPFAQATPSSQIRSRLFAPLRGRSRSGCHSRPGSMPPARRSPSPPTSPLARLAETDAKLRAMRAQTQLWSLHHQVGLPEWNTDTSIPAVYQRPAQVGVTRSASPQVVSRQRAPRAPRPWQDKQTPPVKGSRRPWTTEGEVRICACCNARVAWHCWCVPESWACTRMLPEADGATWIVVSEYMVHFLLKRGQSCW
jgi:hypothetical protein